VRRVLEIRNRAFLIVYSCIFVVGATKEYYTSSGTAGQCRRKQATEVVTWEVAMRVLESRNNGKLDKQPSEGKKSDLQQVGEEGGEVETH
jgi:hypothetical protein